MKYTKNNDELRQIPNPKKRYPRAVPDRSRPLITAGSIASPGPGKNDVVLRAKNRSRKQGSQGPADVLPTELRRQSYSLEACICDPNSTKARLSLSSSLYQQATLFDIFVGDFLEDIALLEVSNTC